MRIRLSAHTRVVVDAFQRLAREEGRSMLRATHDAAAADRRNRMPSDGDEAQVQFKPAGPAVGEPALKRFIALAFAALIAVGASPAGAQDRPLVRTSSGPVLGVEDGSNLVFKGIPYAAPPVGPLRWEPPAPPAAWSAPRDAGAFGAICPQPKRPDGILAMGSGGAQSEDCLSLNVWAPRGARRAPVMVWIHGGAYRFGSGGAPIYDGSAFARDGVVLVSINYRLGALGWFAHPALTKVAAPGAPLGNYGLMDQMAALRWVRANIAAFGGDPANVTVFGESAGGGSILGLLAAPSAKGLFAKAIVESGGGWSAPRGLAEAERAGAELVTQAGLPGAQASLADLRALPPEKLFQAGAGLGALGPFADGRLLPESPTQAFARGHALDVPMMIGSNSDEASLMKAFMIPTDRIAERLTPAMRAAYADLPSDEARARAVFTDTVMGGPARWVAAKAAGGAPAYLYHFSYVPTVRRETANGAAHGGEILYVFETGSKLLARFISPQDHAMETLVHSCWIGFAKTGRPSCAGGAAWPAYDPGDDRLMEFGLESGVRSQFHKAALDAVQQAAGF